MFFHILKRDLKRKKTVNIILLIFVILSTMFVASGLNNIMSILSGTDYFFDQAEIGNLVVIALGQDSVGTVDAALKEEETVRDYRVEEILVGAKGNVFLSDGNNPNNKQTLIFQSYENTAIKLFNKNNELITNVPEGEVYIAGYFIKNNKLKEGDVIRIKFRDNEVSLKIAGQAKDALLGSSFMGNVRFVMNEKDYAILTDDEEIRQYNLGEIGYINTDDIPKTSSLLSGVTFTRGTLKLCYVMDLILAFITLILSICMMIVSFLVLKFSISLTIADEFREIGVMKAIGIKNKPIRRLYVFKYFALACIGGVIGFFASIPFGKALLSSVSVNMMLENSLGITVNLIGMAIVVILIPLYAYHATKKIKKSSPIDAIRSGQTGERYNSKVGLRLGKTRFGTKGYMAWNDVLSAPKRFLTILISLFLCTILMLVIANTVNTMRSDKMVNSFSLKSDLYFAGKDDIDYAFGPVEKLENRIDGMEKKLADAGMPAKVHTQLFLTYNVTVNGTSQTVNCVQGFRDCIADYDYPDGTVIPQNKNEVMITKAVSELIGAKVGDTITIDIGTEKLDCIVTDYCDTMNQLGKTIRLHEDSPINMQYCSGMNLLCIDFTDNPSKKEIEKRKERILELFDADRVLNATEYCAEMFSVTETMDALKYALLGLTLIVIVLITILMERSFIADEKNQIAILKAVGFKHKDIIGWHTYRFGLVALIAVLLAAALSVPMTNLCINPIFRMMGAAKVHYRIDVFQIFLLYPGIVFVATVISTWLVAQNSRSISCRDTASIE